MTTLTTLTTGNYEREQVVTEDDEGGRYYGQEPTVAEGGLNNGIGATTTTTTNTTNQGYGRRVDEGATRELGVPVEARGEEEGYSSAAGVGGYGDSISSRPVVRERSSYERLPHGRTDDSRLIDEEDERMGRSHGKVGADGSYEEEGAVKAIGRKLGVTV